LFDYIVVGSGFAGAIIAERLASQLDKKILILEKRSHIGGNCYDSMDENSILIHKYGPHLFHTDNKKVFDYLSQFTDWHEYQHKVLAFIDNQKIPIPFNFNSIDKVFPKITAQRIEKKLLNKFGKDAKIPILILREENDEDLKKLADYVYEKVFLNYSAKQWGVKPEEIDPAVTARVPVLIGRDNRYFNDQYQAVPVYGYTAIFKKMLHHPNIEVMLNTDFREIMQIGDVNSILFEGEKFTGTLIFTGMIDELFNYKFGALPYRSLDMKFETLPQKIFQETATINYPNDFDFTRITEFKHIHPSAEAEKTTILKEYPKDCVIDKDIPYYPVFNDKNKEKYMLYKKLAEGFNNLIMLGRLAEYKYYDMDDIIERSLKIFEEIENGK